MKRGLILTLWAVLALIPLSLQVQVAAAQESPAPDVDATEAEPTPSKGGPYFMDTLKNATWIKHLPANIGRGIKGGVAFGYHKITGLPGHLKGPGKWGVTGGPSPYGRYYGGVHYSRPWDDSEQLRVFVTAGTGKVYGGVGVVLYGASYDEQGPLGSLVLSNEGLHGNISYRWNTRQGGIFKGFVHLGTSYGVRYRSIQGLLPFISYEHPF